MAEAGYNESSVVLPSMFGDPGSAMENALNRKQQDKRFDYQIRKENEMDEWRKLNLIQDLTNLDKHQTGSDVANAIGNKQASSILQKYTAAAKKMSPSELLANVQKDMQGTITGMEAMKNELAISDEQLKVLKTQFPELDISSLAKDHRADILNRRIKDDEGFVNPLEVGQSQVDFSNPEFLSRYATGNKNLSENIINPKGLEDTTVLTGSPDSNTKWASKVPFWKKPNFEQEAMKQGFLGKDFIPNLELKSTTIPADALPSSNGKPFEVIDREVLDRFTQDGKMNLELIAATRDKFPSYDNFNQTEKEYAKRNVLHDQIKALDQSNFHPVENRRPARTTVNVSGSGGANPDALINKVYERINSKIDYDLGRGFNATRYNALENDGQEVVKKAVENAGYEVGEGGENVFIRKDSAGNIRVYRTSEGGKLLANPENEIATLSYTGTNLPKQANVRGKVETVEKGETGKAITKPPQPADDGYTRDELKKAGWTDDQINKAQKAGKIKVK